MDAAIQARCRLAIAAFALAGLASSILFASLALLPKRRPRPDFADFSALMAESGDAGTGEAIKLSQEIAAYEANFVEQLISVLAFFGGTVFYISRRATGTVLVPIVLHALFDFSVFSHTGDTRSISAVESQVLLGIVFVLFVAVLIGRKAWSDHATPDAGQPSMES